MISSYLPAIFVPIVGIVFPLISMALLFIYIELSQFSVEGKGIYNQEINEYYLYYELIKN